MMFEYPASFLYFGLMLRTVYKPNTFTFLARSYDPLLTIDV